MDPKNINFQDVINGIPDPIMVIDVNNYKIISSNAALKEQVGGEDPVAKGMLCYQATHRRDSPCKGAEEPCILYEVISTKKPVRATHIHFDNDNNKLFVDIIAAPIFDKNGEVIQVIESIRDITQIKKAEKAIKKHAKGLEESNSLKDLFIDIMRHDLLGPIGVIGNSSEFLLEEGSAEEKKKLINIINSSAASLIEIIEDASKYAMLNELETVKLQIFDANKLLKRGNGGLRAFSKREKHHN